MKRLALTFALVLPMAVACGGSKDPRGSNHPGRSGIEYPEWVKRGSGAFGGEKKIICTASDRRPASGTALPARTTADNRARRDPEGSRPTRPRFMKDFQESATAGDFSASDESQLSHKLIKTFSAGTLNGVEVVDH